jgi:hypothetical protein
MKISNTLKNYYMSKNDKHYKNEESFCLNCNSKIKFGRKFCNSKCQGEYGTKQKFIKIEESGYFPANKNTNDTDFLIKFYNELGYEIFESSCSDQYGMLKKIK